MHTYINLISVSVYLAVQLNEDTINKITNKNDLWLPNENSSILGTPEELSEQITNYKELYGD